MTVTRTLKLASHIHSDWSDDSDWRLPDLVRLLRRLGYDGALVCDHDRTMTEDRRQQLVGECAELSSNGFILVPGVEYQDRDHVVHIPVFGDVPFFGRSPNISDLLPAMDSAGAVSVFAHPVRRDAYRRFDSRWAPHLTAIEVWNRKYDGVAPNRWAVGIAETHSLISFVGLDFHGPRQIFPLGVRVTTATATPAGVLSAIRSGAVASTAFGINVDRFADRVGTVIFGSAEGIRRRAAPMIRKIERGLRPPRADH